MLYKEIDYFLFKMLTCAQVIFLCNPFSICFYNTKKYIWLEWKPIFQIKYILFFSL